MSKTEMREVNVILDTNILINTPECFYTFIPEEDNKQVNVILNSVVIVELDNNKSGFSAKAVNSRLASKSINKILDMGGVIGKNCNLIIIHNSYGIDEKSYMGHDKIIIETVLDVSNENKDSKLISNDNNVLILAKSKGIVAETFKNDCVDTTSIYEEIKTKSYADLTDKQIQLLNEEKLKPSDIGLSMIPNEAIIFNENDIFTFKKGTLKRLQYPRIASGIKPRNLEQQIFMNQVQDEDVRIAVSISKSGTGKSLIALASALDMVDRGLYDKVIVLKSVTAMAQEEIGYNKGFVDTDKTYPHFENTFDALETIFNLKKSGFQKDGQKIQVDGFSIFEQLKEMGKMDVKTLTFLRGTSKDRTIFICEEFQNLPLNAVKSTLTRLSDSSKAILCSDIMQIDNKFLNEANNGATLLVDKLRGQEFFSFVNLKTSERGKVCDIISDLL